MRNQRGYTLMEAIAAVALLSMVVLVASGVLMRRHSAAREVDERLRALSHVSNAMNEILASGSFAERTAELDAAATGLRDARALVIVDHQPDGLVFVKVELRWARGGHVTRETLVVPR